MKNQMNPQVMQQSYTPDSGTRIIEIEEKLRLIKDRALLIGENLISTKEEQENENQLLKKKIKQLEDDIRLLKQLNQRVIYELQNLARKSDVEILKKQFKMFEPLEIARIKDVKRIVKEEVKRILK